jgi:hypothetical protein
MPEVKGLRVTRRTAVAGIAGVGITAALAANFSLSGTSSSSTKDSTQSGSQRGTTSLAYGNIGDWIAVVGTTFRSGTERLRLVGVQPLESDGVRPPEVTRTSAFAAVFDVLNGAVLPGDLIYSIYASNIAPFDIFMSSARTAQYPARLHAVFN